MDESSFDGFEHLHLETPYLRIVVKDARSRNRVLQALEEIVEVAPPSVGRVALERKRNRPGELFEPSEAAYDHRAVLSPRAAYEDARPDVAVVVVDAGRPGEVEL
jgi:hypothetical protein